MNSSTGIAVSVVVFNVPLAARVVAMRLIVTVSGASMIVMKSH